MTQYFKFLNEDGTAAHGGSGKWNLPTENRAGKWMPKIDNITPCVRGYHLCEAKDLLDWVAPALFVAEYRGERIDDNNKFVVSEARLLRRVKTWNEKTARLFACDCAERVLGVFEKEYPDDPRPRQAVETARKFANGEASQEERDAAMAAAWDAAMAAARDAARAASWAAARAVSWAAARAAATDASWAAAMDAARAASWAAARAAATDAAMAAAWDAAMDAARAAARAAATDAAMAASWAAAMDAAKRWQTAHLLEMLGLEASQ